jgi:hypothetical protein
LPFCGPFHRVERRQAAAAFKWFVDTLNPKSTSVVHYATLTDCDQLASILRRIIIGVREPMGRGDRRASSTASVDGMGEADVVDLQKMVGALAPCL